MLTGDNADIISVYDLAEDIFLQHLCKLCIILLIIHQIFSLARDWSKRVTWVNIPQLKLGNIRGYSPIFKTARVA